MTDNSLTEVYLEHKSGFNTILGCEAGMTNGGSPENAFSGYIYTFKLNQTVLYAGSDVGDDYANSGCTGACTTCPVSSQNTCLWEVAHDLFELSDGSALTCDKNNVDASDDCGSAGCQRQDDCNRCFDRVCNTCTNFDEIDPFGATSCTACMSNASFQGTTPDTCACNAGYYFDESSDACVACDPLCDTCTTVSNKSCTDCSTNAFL